MQPLPLFLISFQLCAFATAALNFSIVHSGPHHLLNTTSICLPPVYLPSTHPSYPACLHAIRLLPSSHEFGIFHTGSPMDRFSLPVVKTYRTGFHTGDNCLVKVELKRDILEEMCTWNAIVFAARRLAGECRQRTEGRDITGGTTLAGSNDGIIVSLERGGGGIVVVERG